MLVITTGNTQTVWHCGGPLPELTGRVVSLQADGHELDWLRDVIAAGQAQADANYNLRVWGRHQ